MIFMETPRFPDDIAHGSQSTVIFSTDIHQVIAGYEIRNMNWRHPLHAYNVVYGIRYHEQLDILRQFFHLTRGMYASFRYKDWSDFTVDYDESGFLYLGDNRWQCVKRYGNGDYAYLRPIRKLVAGSMSLVTGGGALPDVSVWIPPTMSTTEAAIEEYAGWSVDINRGIVTTTQTPVSWAGEFDVPVRFSSDDMSVSYDDHAYGSVQTTLREVRVW